MSAWRRVGLRRNGVRGSGRDREPATTQARRESYCGAGPTVLAALATARRPARTGRRTPASGLNTTEVREWAKAQGIDVKDRGRVPAELVVKFKAATGH